MFFLSRVYDFDFNFVLHSQGVFGIDIVIKEALQAILIEWIFLGLLLKRLFAQNDYSAAKNILLLNLYQQIECLGFILPVEDCLLFNAFENIFLNHEQQEKVEGAPWF